MSSHTYDEDDLDAVFLSLEEEEQAEIMETSGADDWGDLNPQEKLDHLVAIGAVPEDASYVETITDDDEDDPAWEDDRFEDIDLEVTELFVEDELPQVETERDGPVVVIAGSEMPGATNVTISGDGFESQYLREIEGSGEDVENEYFEDAPSDLGGSDNNVEGEVDEGEEPPLHIEVEGYIGQDLAIYFHALRGADNLFTIEILDRIYEDMELRDFTRELTGDQPYAYECRLEFAEWREIELEGDEEGENEYFGDADSEDADEEDEAEDMESGSPDDPNVIEQEEGESTEYAAGDGEANNTIFDTTADAAEALLTSTGSGWALRDLGWRAEDNRSGIVSDGSGKIANVFLGHGGDSGIVIEDATEVEVSRINLQHSSNGIHIVETDVGELADTDD